MRADDRYWLSCRGAACRCRIIPLNLSSVFPVIIMTRCGVYDDFRAVIAITLQNMYRLHSDADFDLTLWAQRLEGSRFDFLSAFQIMAHFRQGPSIRLSIRRVPPTLDVHFQGCGYVRSYAHGHAEAAIAMFSSIILPAPALVSAFKYVYSSRRFDSEAGIVSHFICLHIGTTFGRMQAATAKYGLSRSALPPCV